MYARYLLTQLDSIHMQPSLLSAPVAYTRNYWFGCDSDFKNRLWVRLKYNVNFEYICCYPSAISWFSAKYSTNSPNRSWSSVSDILCLLLKCNKKKPWAMNDWMTWILIESWFLPAMNICYSVLWCWLVNFVTLTYCNTVSACVFQNFLCTKLWKVNYVNFQSCFRSLVIVPNVCFLYTQNSHLLPTFIKLCIALHGSYGVAHMLNWFVHVSPYENVVNK